MCFSFVTYLKTEKVGTLESFLACQIQAVSPSKRKKEWGKKGCFGPLTDRTTTDRGEGPRERAFLATPVLLDSRKVEEEVGLGTWVGDLGWGRENGWNGHFSGLLFVLSFFVTARACRSTVTTLKLFFPPFPADTFLRFSSGLLLFSLERRAATFGLPLPPDFLGTTRV